jgi:cytochrome c
MSATTNRWTGTRVLVATLVVALVLPATAGGAAEACTAGKADDGYRMLFDGTADSLEGWQQSGPGRFTLTEDCTLRSEGGLGLLWYAAEAFSSYTLKLDWKIDKLVDNSGIFVGFPAGGTHTHNVAINNGYEVQIDQLGRSDGNRNKITGAIYNIQGPNRDTRTEVARPSDWNTYEITVDNPRIIVRLNGVVVNTFTSTSPARDLSLPTHFGLQNHGAPDTAYFRNVQVKEIAPGTGGGGPVEPAGDISRMRNNVGIAQLPTSSADFDGVGYSYSAQALQLAGVTPGGTVTAGGFSFTWPTTSSGAADNVVAAGQVVPITAPAGATKLAFLGAADHGPSTGTFRLTYAAADGTETVVDRNATFSDWTLAGGTAGLAPGNVVAIETQYRSFLSAVPMTTKAYVFVVTIPLDPSMTLKSVRLPAGYAGRIHLFDVAAG